VVKQRPFADAILLSGNGGNPLIETGVRRAANASDPVTASPQRRGAGG